MTYLADTSAVWRLLRGQVGDPWPGNVASGLVAICPPVASELMVSVRSESDYEPFFAVLRRTFAWCPALDDPWRHILSVQRDLIAMAHHRGPSPIDILIALTARQHRLTVVHADHDFASIAKVRPDIAMLKVNSTN